MALKVINYFKDDLFKPISEGGKRAVFLVSTVCLATQHLETIAEVLEMNVACWTGNTKKKTWGEKRFREEFEKHQVIVATAQLFLDAVKHSFISIKDINVLILDEAHNARKVI